MCHNDPIDVFVSRMESDECHWDNVIDYIQIGYLGFCGCGSLEENLEYIMDGLAYIDERPNGKEEFNEWIERGHKIFGNELSKSFFFYWADKEELSEHGSSIPGWLTDKGKELLAALRKFGEPRNP